MVDGRCTSRSPRAFRVAGVLERLVGGNILTPLEPVGPDRPEPANRIKRQNAFNLTHYRP